MSARVTLRACIPTVTLRDWQSHYNMVTQAVNHATDNFIMGVMSLVSPGAAIQLDPRTAAVVLSVHVVIVDTVTGYNITEPQTVPPQQYYISWPSAVLPQGRSVAALVTVTSISGVMGPPTTSAHSVVESSAFLTAQRSENAGHVGAAVHPVSGSQLLEVQCSQATRFSSSRTALSVRGTGALVDVLACTGQPIVNSTALITSTTSNVSAVATLAAGAVVVVSRVDTSPCGLSDIDDGIEYFLVAGKPVCSCNLGVDSVVSDCIVSKRS